MVKGRLSSSLNELRYRKCFAIRSTKFLRPFNDFALQENGAEGKRESTNEPEQRIVDKFWLRNESTVCEWLELVSGLCEAVSGQPTDLWK